VKFATVVLVCSAVDFESRYMHPDRLTVKNRHPTQALTGPCSTPEHSTVVNRSNSGLKHKGHVRMMIVVASVVVHDVVAGAFAIVAVSDAVASVVVRDVADILFEVAVVLAVVA
jgi:hypothetical protein